MLISKKIHEKDNTSNVQARATKIPYIIGNIR